MKKILAFIKSRFKPLFLCKAGATAVEYALIAALIAVAAQRGFQQTGRQLFCIYAYVADTMISVPNSGCGIGSNIG
jgi:Flp pilus assembly pilin Flp